MLVQQFLHMLTCSNILHNTLKCSTYTFHLNYSGDASTKQNFFISGVWLTFCHKYTTYSRLLFSCNAVLLLLISSLSCNSCCCPKVFVWAERIVNTVLSHLMWAVCVSAIYFVYFHLTYVDVEYSFLYMFSGFNACLWLNVHFRGELPLIGGIFFSLF